MKWGKDLRFLTDLQDGGTKVKALEERPVLLPGMDFYLDAYKDLIFDRPIGLAVGPIPWSSIDRWAIRHEVETGEDFEDLVFYIRQVEEAVNDYKAKLK